MIHAMMPTCPPSRRFKRRRPESLAGAKLDLKIAVERLGDPKQGVYARRSPTAFEPGDRGLRRRDRMRQLGLGKAQLASSLGHAVRDPRKEPAVLCIGEPLGPSAAAFLVAHFYTFDPYYLPSMIRVSERDFMPPAIVFSVAGLAIAAGFLARNRPSLGLALSAR
jgi:hypothetical protein